MKMIKVLWLPVLLFPVFLSCKSSGSSLDIVGGRLVRANERIARHTVAIVDGSDQLEPYCTGVLVAPQVVLTAAHCFRTPHADPLLFFGNILPDSREKDDGRFYSFKKVVLHPEFSLARLDAYDKRIKDMKYPHEVPDPGQPLHDLALISFVGEVPEPFVPVSLVRTFTTVKQGTAAAYGCLSTVCDEYSNRLRKVTMEVFKTLDQANLVVMYAGENRGTCPGDSGGPDFMEGASGLELFSIIDTGPDSCEAGISIETLVAPYEAWITRSIAEL